MFNYMTTKRQSNSGANGEIQTTNNNTVWTEDDIQILKSFLDGVSEYKTYRELSGLLKRSPQAIKNKLRQIVKHPPKKRKRAESIASFASADGDTGMQKELEDMIVSADARKIFIWYDLENIDETILNASNDIKDKKNYDWLIKKERGVAIAISTDVELAKIQLAHEINSTGIWNGTTDSFIEQLNNSKYNQFELSDFSILIPFV